MEGRIANAMLTKGTAEERGYDKEVRALDAMIQCQMRWLIANPNATSQILEKRVDIIDGVLTKIGKLMFPEGSDIESSDPDDR